MGREGGREGGRETGRGLSGKSGRRRRKRGTTRNRQAAKEGERADASGRIILTACAPSSKALSFGYVLRELIRGQFRRRRR